jgi:hypothetical protein
VDLDDQVREIKDGETVGNVGAQRGVDVFWAVFSDPLPVVRKNT